MTDWQRYVKERYGRVDPEAFWASVVSSDRLRKVELLNAALLTDVLEKVEAALWPTDLHTNNAMAVDLRSLKPGDPCPRCRVPLKALLADPYCPNDCDRTPAPVAVEKTEPIWREHLSEWLP